MLAGRYNFVSVTSVTEGLTKVKLRCEVTQLRMKLQLWSYKPGY